MTLRPNAFKRCLANLISNAQSHAKHISIEAVRDQRFLTVHVDDDGPGIPLEPARRGVPAVFPSRQCPQSGQGGTGLGLAIARDIARSHGGDIGLADSRPGACGRRVRVPV